MSTEDEGRTGSRPQDDQTHEVGSLGAEAVRLLGALSGWAAQQGSDVQGGAGDVFRQACDGAQSFARGMDEHLATGAAECTWCPICRTLHTVRALSPEVRTHLSSAAASLVSAAAALLGTTVDESRAGASKPRSGADRAPRVQHIDLDNTGDDSEPEPRA